LRAVLEEDTGLREMATSPLMVNIMLMTLEGMGPVASRLGDTFEERKHHLFDAYIDNIDSVILKSPTGIGRM
jgi:hypothetical protein